MPTRRRSVLLLAQAGAFVLALAALPAQTRAQVPAPHIADTAKRSGLIGRFVPIESTLPPDKKRDSWYNTRWGDPPNVHEHMKCYKNGGMYGLPWRATNTKSVYPYFLGSPGEDTLTDDVRPLSFGGRLTRSFLHPYKPVGMYYEQGSYVPVYDTRPLIAGPGSWPFPFFISSTHGGG